MAKWIVIIIAALNMIAFAIMGIDKFKAKKGLWRVPEKWLLMFPMFGGAFGFMAAMLIFKHKLSKPIFVWSAFIFGCGYFSVMIWKLLESL